MLLNSKVF